MTRRHASLCLSLFTFTAACGDDLGGDTEEGSTAAASTTMDGATSEPTGGGDTTAGDTTAGDTDGIEYFGGCGLEPYAMLDAADMGEVLDHEMVVDFEPTAIDALLEAQGFGMLVPVKYGARVYKIRYTTQDRGAGVEATAFVSFPKLDVPADRPVVMYAHGTGGLIVHCK